MRVSVVSLNDPRDPRFFSGTIRSVLNALEAEMDDVQIAYPSYAKVLRLLLRVVSRLTGGKVDITRLPWVMRIVSADVIRQLKKQNCDVAVCVAASGLAAFVGKQMPMVHFSDTTIRLVRPFYPVFIALSENTAKGGEKLEQAAIDNAMMVTVSSPWAGRSVVEDYGKQADKVFVAPWGCNFAPVDAGEVLGDETVGARCRLLFAGVEWYRKGGDIVLETAHELERRGFDFQIDFAGASPEDVPQSDRLNFHGMLRKSDPEQGARLQQLFRESSILFLPTRQDCTPMVFAEANAYGVPVITADVGGVSGVIIEGESGFILPADSSPQDFADLIERIWSKRETYLELRKSARRAYEDEFNWAVWARRFRKKLEEVMS